ncbi:hypothetical protein E2C01_058159 [Portunus trituberculatus]|uniref:Uncharacterized protein n=1 Tax=Portunus trituberculatus TaxID=210409 RepID=A0A5B7H4J6_PORTR|nr:hypothetical protein [Portunus trituberculatus]
MRRHRELRSAGSMDRSLSPYRPEDSRHIFEMTQLSHQTKGQTYYPNELQDHQPQERAFTMTVPVARETLKRAGNKAPNPKIDGTDINTVREAGTKEGGLSLYSLKHAVSRAWEMLQYLRLRNIFSPHEHPFAVLLQISLRNRADLFGKVPGGIDEIPTPISVIRHKQTWRRDLANFRN